MNDERLDTIETKLAYQEDALEKLNNVVTSQQALIDNLEKACKYLNQRIDELTPDEPGKPADERPPHY